jgi:hypothetical protein
MAENSILVYRNLHVPSVTRKGHSVTLWLTWMNNHQTVFDSLLDYWGKQNNVFTMLHFCTMRVTDGTQNGNGRDTKSDGRDTMLIMK